jgi:hypothetical protein
MCSQGKAAPSTGHERTLMCVRDGAQAPTPPWLFGAAPQEPKV